MSATVSDPIRHVEYLVSELPKDCKLAVPSIGIDFGSYHVRTAVVCEVDGKISINLATFHISSVEAALSHAKKVQPKEANIRVFYTGHSTVARVALLEKTFFNAQVTINKVTQCFLYQNEDPSTTVDGYKFLEC